MRRILALILALMLLGVGAVAEKPDYLNTDLDYPVVAEGTDITIRVLAEQHDTYGRDVDSVWFWKWATERMNIKFDVTLVPWAQLTERKNLMFAAADLPDLLLGMGWPGLTPDELVRYGQIEGQLMVLNDYIDEYMPTLLKFFDKYPSMKSAATAPDGNIYTIPCYVSDERNIADTARIYIRSSWLEEAGMETPNTLDEFTAMLRKFKELHPESVPLTGGEQFYDERFYVLNALGYVGTDSLGVEPMLRNGEATIPCGEPDYIHYLETLNTWYTEGLMDENYFTNDVTMIGAQVDTGIAGTSPNMPFVFTTNPDIYLDYWACLPLTSEWNDTKTWPRVNNYIIGQCCFSSKTKYPELLASFMDFFYTDMGAIYGTFGPAADSEDTLGMIGGYYIKEDGSAGYVDVDNGKFSNQYEYRMAVVSPCHNSHIGNYGGSIDDPECPEFDNLMQKIAGAPIQPIELDLPDGGEFAKHSLILNLMPYVVDQYPTNLYMDEAVNVRMTDLKTVIKNYVRTECAKFITGIRPLSEFEDYLKALHDIGYDEYKQICVDAYQAYMSN